MTHLRLRHSLFIVALLLCVAHPTFALTPCESDGSCGLISSGRTVILYNASAASLIPATVARYPTASSAQVLSASASPACAVITNASCPSAGGETLMVPYLATSSPSEWTSFNSHPPACATVKACVTTISCTSATFTTAKGWTVPAGGATITSWRLLGGGGGGGGGNVSVYAYGGGYYGGNGGAGGTSTMRSSALGVIASASGGAGGPHNPYWSPIAVGAVGGAGSATSASGNVSLPASSSFAVYPAGGGGGGAGAYYGGCYLSWCGGNAVTASWGNGGNGGNGASDTSSATAGYQSLGYGGSWGQAGMYGTGTAHPQPSAGTGAGGAGGNPQFWYSYSNGTGWPGSGSGGGGGYVQFDYTVNGSSCPFQ